MKTRLTTLLFILIQLIVHAQVPVFAPLGARWWYSQDEKWPPYDQSYWRFEVEKDTVIEGYNLRKVNQSHIWEEGGFTGQFYIYNDSGHIYIYNEGTHTLLDYFNLLAEQGDTIKTTEGFDGYGYSLVDSIGYVDIAGESLKRFYLTAVGDFDYYFGSSTFTERIGGNGYFFATYGAVDPPPGGPLRCYEDSIIGLYGSDLVADCEYIQTGIQELGEIDFSVYPNPVRDKIYLTLNENQQPLIQLSDISGRKINLDLVMTGDDLYESDISFLPEGIYMVSVFIDNILVRYEKLIKL